MDSLASARVVQVPADHLKQCSRSFLCNSLPRVTLKLHQSSFGMLKTSKIITCAASPIQPLQASTINRFDNTLPSKDVLELWRNIDAVCFDVDSTVCKDEGIDEFAEFCGAGKAVAEWTLRAMNGSVTFQEALAARLSLINPSLSQLQDFLEKRPPRFDWSDHLSRARLPTPGSVNFILNHLDALHFYCVLISNHVSIRYSLSPGIADLVRKLKAKNIDVYLVSGGFRQMINPVASILEIPLENIFANQLLFGNSGEFLGFDENEPTSKSGGKPVAVQRIRKAHGYKTLGMIGDGATDLEARQPGGADLFICYAGVQLRETVAAKADWLVFSFKDLIDSLEQ
ncbi:hypothetical protein KSS87_018710 [Heliosperma pusillum]|nr:hypothetical protein KSS87_018710 [Heliosperma pusillum]